MAKTEDSSSSSGIVAGSPVIVNLHSPREKVWGVLRELNAAGVFVRGIDLNTFDDWLRMVVRGERNLSLTHVFLPMWRVERVALDESVDDIPRWPRNSIRELELRSASISTQNEDG
jgi:hypothetical protein